MSTRLRQIDLRAGTPGDIGVVDTLMSQSFDARYGEAWTRNQCMGVLALPGVWLTIAEIDAKPAGFALARAILDEAELLLLATTPVQRRRGVGAALLRSVIADAKARGIARLHLEVREGNEAGLLYRAFGFVQVGERRGYYRGRDGQAYHARTLSMGIG